MPSFPIQKFREIVFLLLYAADCSKESQGEVQENDSIPLIADQLTVSTDIVEKAQKMAKQVISKLSEIDPLIEKASLTYSFERIHSVERNLLRLGVFELIFEKKAPPKVIFSEMLRLAKKFATPEAAAFINALLDNIYRMHYGLELDSRPLTLAIENLSKSEKTTRESDDRPRISDK